MSEPQRYVHGFEAIDRERCEALSNYRSACTTIAKMHEAAMGEITGPRRGVVEDIVDLKSERDRLAARVDELERDIAEMANGAKARALAEHKAAQKPGE